MFGKISSISLKYNLYSTFLKKKKKKHSLPPSSCDFQSVFILEALHTSRLTPTCFTPCWDEPEKPPEKPAHTRASKRFLSISGWAY